MWESKKQCSNERQKLNGQEEMKLLGNKGNMSSKTLYTQHIKDRSDILMELYSLAATRASQNETFLHPLLIQREKLNGRQTILNFMLESCCHPLHWTSILRLGSYLCIFSTNFSERLLIIEKNLNNLEETQLVQQIFCTLFATLYATLYVCLLPFCNTSQEGNYSDQRNMQTRAFFSISLEKMTKI